MNRQAARVILIIVTLLWLALALPCGFVGLFSVFLTDSGTLNPDIFAMIFFGLLGFPVAAIVFSSAAWILFYFEKNVAALIVSLVPALELLVPALGFIFLFNQ